MMCLCTYSLVRAHQPHRKYPPPKERDREKKKKKRLLSCAPEITYGGRYGGGGGVGVDGSGGFGSFGSDSFEARVWSGLGLVILGGSPADILQWLQLRKVDWSGGLRVRTQQIAAICGCCGCSVK